MNQVTPITPQVANVIKKTLDFLKATLVSKIEVEYVQLAASSVIDKLKQTADILSDSNVDNKKQLKLLWGSFFTGREAIESVRLALLDAISKVNDVTVKEGLTLLVNPLIETLVAVSDEDFKDGEQLEKIWLDFIRTKEFIDFVQKNLEVILSKFVTNKFVVSLIVSLLDLLEKED